MLAQAHIRDSVAGYHQAKKSLHGASSYQRRYGLDWMNFFIADVQTGFGTFVAFYLARLDWTQETIGIALAAGGVAGVLGRIPGGAIADATTWKRALTALGILMIGAAAISLALTPTVVLVFVAEV